MMLHHNELISIEEDTILGSNRLTRFDRRFTLNNRLNGLCIGISTSGGSLCSVRMEQGTHEVILNTSGPRDSDSSPQQTVSEFQSHVLGMDTLLLSTQTTQSLTYQLTESNELILCGKLKNFHAMSPFYFNLVCPYHVIFDCNNCNASDTCHFPHPKQNSVQLNPNVAGHFLQINLPESSPISPLNIDGDTHLDVMNGVTLNSLSDYDVSHQKVPGLFYDSIISCPKESPEMGLNVLLSYGSRSIQLKLNSNGSSSSSAVTIPKLRLRIRKDGVSISPQMVEFKMVYRFIW